jgi:hypothetical protein
MVSVVRLRLLVRDALEHVNCTSTAVSAAKPRQVRAAIRRQTIARFQQHFQGFHVPSGEKRLSGLHKPSMVADQNAFGTSGQATHVAITYVILIDCKELMTHYGNKFPVVLHNMVQHLGFLLLVIQAGLFLVRISA